MDFKIFAREKGVIPYEMINSFDSLNIILAVSEFFKKDVFHSAPKTSIVAHEVYESVKKFYTLMKMGNLGDLNTL